jgi:RND superfamily putative drug exporter
VPAGSVQGKVAQISNRLPYALGLIAITTFVLLFLMTGPVFLPVKALVMNTLSLGATLGAIEVWVPSTRPSSGASWCRPP